MKLNETLCHLKYCEIGETTSSELQFLYKESSYSIKFNDPRFKKNTGFSITRKNGGFVETSLLSWLMLYFGEDTIDPFAKADTRFNFNRGDFHVSEDDLKAFIACVEKFPRKSHPIWKKDLIEKALSYYSCAVRTGVNLMPLNIGFFALSIECLGNAYYGKRDKYFTLGEFKFRNIIQTRLKRYKQNLNYKKSTKDFEKYINKELELLHLIRNAYYGHSLLHLSSERKILTETLRSWHVRNGHSKKFANITFKSDRLDKDITRESYGLYKVGLKLNRLLFFYFLGFSRTIPFATHDFQVIGKSTNEIYVSTETA